MPKGNERMAVKRSGSVAVTIPAVFAAQLGIKHGSILSFETNGRELIVRKVGEEKEVKADDQP